MIELHNRDCLEVLKELPDKSIDLILQDPPYNITACKWDVAIPLDELWVELKRIIKPNGAIIMTAIQPFTTNLIASNYKMFKYCLVWNKHFGSPSQARYRPIGTFEDIVIFSKNRTTYNPQLIKRDKPIKLGGNKCKSETWKMHPKEGFKKIYEYKQPTSILDFKRDLGRTKHPTQKPVALMEYLIKTYTNEGEIVFDGFMGSGTTGVAAKNLGRDFIGCELDKKYFDIAQERINNA